MDEYFSGYSRCLDDPVRVSMTNVKIILDSVTRELKKDPKRRFTYVEMKFFNLWYKELDQ